jgi:hypothetical protein
MRVNWPRYPFLICLFCSLEIRPEIFFLLGESELDFGGAVGQEVQKVSLGEELEFLLRVFLLLFA